MLRRFDNHDFQGRSNVSIQQVTAMSDAIRLADDDVSMELRIPLSSWAMLPMSDMSSTCS
jgi:hypothetical protein